RLSFQAGDVLETLPPAGSGRDIYLLSAVLHGFDDDACVKGLRNVAAACGSSGARIALLELVLADAADFVGAAFDMQMFMGTQGRERTLTDWRRLFERAGLVLEEQVELRSFARLLLLRLG
ncbi:methyltransferase, partial [Methylogaea oryzae]|uniref:methyltransferase n=1 Tax=Methylogaea oryzae TaxID=1295382 RepID=UPI000A501474